MTAPLDISDTLVAKSDQLNADDIVSGPIIVQILGAKKTDADQPLVLEISGGHRPFKPCLTARRQIAACWGKDAAAWIGRWMRLYRDPDVTYAGMAVGGIRVDGLSHIDSTRTIVLAKSQKKKVQYTIERLSPEDLPRQRSPEIPTEDLDQVLADADLTVPDVDRWRESEGKPPVASLTDDQRGKLAGWLKGNDKALDQIRALLPAT